MQSQIPNSFTTYSGPSKSFSTFNTLKTFALMAAMTALVIGIGWMIGRAQGMIIALVFSLVMNFVGYWWSDKIALSMSGAREVGPSEAPELHAMVGDLARRADLPMPRVAVIPQMAPNAFATGRDPKHSAVAVTEGIMQMLDRDELEGVISHELAHIKHRDILISSVAAVMAGAISHLAYMLMWFGGGGDDDEGGNPLGIIGLLATIILAPIAAMLIQMAISRSREYEADRGGALICGRPMSLANALLKLERGNQLAPMHVDPATAHMYIVSPLSGQSLAGLFSTHPATAERVARLEAMSRETAFAPSSLRTYA